MESDIFYCVRVFFSHPPSPLHPHLWPSSSSLSHLSPMGALLFLPVTLPTILLFPSYLSLSITSSFSHFLSVRFNLVSPQIIGSGHWNSGLQCFIVAVKVFVNLSFIPVVSKHKGNITFVFIMLSWIMILFAIYIVTSVTILRNSYSLFYDQGYLILVLYLKKKHNYKIFFFLLF